MDTPDEGVPTRVSARVGRSAAPRRAESSYMPGVLGACILRTIRHTGAARMNHERGAVIGLLLPVSPTRRNYHAWLEGEGTQKP